MEETEMKKPGLSLPMAIVIAGVLVALAIVGGFVYTKKSGSPATAGQPGATPDVRAVSADDHILGSKDAPVQIITYTDLECPFCKVFHATLKQVNQDYGASSKVAIIYRDFPIASLHSKSKTEFIATECAAKLGGNDKYWAYVDKIFAATPSNNGLDLSLLPKFAADLGLDSAKFADCTKDSSISKKIDQQIAEATSYGAQGTPFPIFMYKGKFQGYIAGALPYEATTDKSGQKSPGVKTIIDQLLAGK